MRKSVKGFSLLEVIVALGILATTFTALMTTQSGHVLLSERAEYMSTAVLLAREKLSELELQYRLNPVPSDEPEPEIHPINEKPFGDDFPTYGYKVTIRKVEIPLPKGIFEMGTTEVDPNLVNSTSMVSEFISKAVRELRLEVFWESSSGPDHIEIVTHLVDINANLGVVTQ